MAGAGGGSDQTSGTSTPLRIGVIGSGVADSMEIELARAVGVAIGRAEAITVCGGLDGVMQGAAEGAASEGGVVLGLLPGPSARDAAPGVTIPVPTGMGEARNVLVVRTSEVVIAIGGRMGTLTEAAFCQKFGVPVIGLFSELPDLVIDELAQNPAAAVARAVELAQAGRRRNG